ncbi:hypothetical protein BO78DRAFT_438674 [Aspergillus sclerotiicarbonarius CBS 121057]|uniref:Uncharacterized protein n=1 Tax=Aspergillus sclerotiicarbonarius (strain CBS 121057 / IBT 28362) TaxID=1448318 RepID=A0A319DRY4_ASPSB|nr:hypothetical protein BO78DRAFT_438674 [Aspergillus sclerotiicarbonarius CBS 121057]
MCFDRFAYREGWIPVPDLNLKEGGPISLGNIIMDPQNPTEVLTVCDQSTLTRGDESKLSSKYISRWISKSECAPGSVYQLDHGSSEFLRFDYELHEWYVKEFDYSKLDEYIKAKIDDPKLCEAMGVNNHLFSKPAYMITGIKVAKRFTLNSERKQWIHQGVYRGGCHMGRCMMLAIGKGVSEEACRADTHTLMYGHDKPVDIPVKASRSCQFHHYEEVILAYQLTKIVVKGWDTKELQMQDYRPREPTVRDLVAMVEVSCDNKEQSGEKACYRASG